MLKHFRIPHVSQIVLCLLGKYCPPRLLVWIARLRIQGVPHSSRHRAYAKGLPCPAEKRRNCPNNTPTKLPSVATSHKLFADTLKHDNSGYITRPASRYQLMENTTAFPDANTSGNLFLYGLGDGFCILFVEHLGAHVTNI